MVEEKTNNIGDTIIDFANIDHKNYYYTQSVAESPGIIESINCLYLSCKPDPFMLIIGV